MSNLAANAEQPSDVKAGCGSLLLTIQPRLRDLGGFSVRRVLPTAERRMVGPWIFFDHFGPVEFPVGHGFNVRPHPHVNLATVTYLFEGEILHRDSLGSRMPIAPGDINLMVCGSGIVHSERERPEVTAVPHRLHGLQLWLALPVADEETDAAFYHYPAADLPAVRVDGVAIRVMMGKAYGVTSPVKPFGRTLYAEAHLEPGQAITLPEAEERGVFVAEGQLRAREDVIPEHAMAVFGPDEGIVLTATTRSRIAIIGGENIGHRHIEWNFVSSRKERIEQAKRDWKSGRFPKVPGDEFESIPLPE